MVVDNTTNIAEQAEAENEPIPQVNVDWLNPGEIQHRHDVQIGEEVNRRIRREQERLHQDRTATNHTWNTQTEEDVIAPMPINVHQPGEVEGDSDSDSDQEVDLPSLTPRRKRSVKTPHKLRHQPGRRSKHPVNYKGMFAMSNIAAEVDKDTTSSILNNDSAFLSTLDLCGSGFQPTPATHIVNQHTYLLKDETYEDVHPLAFMAKVQSHDADNPTYSDILRCDNEERKL